MNYVLDTNACIHTLRKKGNALVKARLNAHSAADIALSAVGNAELYFGAARSSNPAVANAQTVAFIKQFAILPVDDHVAEIAGSIRADLASRGETIGPNDLLIAATALRHDLILVTHNTNELSRVPGLKLKTGKSHDAQSSRTAVWGFRTSQ